MTFSDNGAVNRKPEIAILVDYVHHSQEWMKIEHKMLQLRISVHKFQKTFVIDCCFLILILAFGLKT